MKSLALIGAFIHTTVAISLALIGNPQYATLAVSLALLFLVLRISLQLDEAKK